MAKISIAPKSRERLPTPLKYLAILSTSGVLYVGNEVEGVQFFNVKQNSNIETAGTNALFFDNQNDETLIVEYQLTDLRVTQNNNDTVELSGAIVVEKINQRVDTLASVTVSQANTTQDFVDIVLASGDTRLIAGNDEKRKKLTVQAHGENFATCRVGSVVASNKGKILTGGNGQIGTLTHDATDEIYIMNTSAFAINITTGVERYV